MTASMPRNGGRTTQCGLAPSPLSPLESEDPQKGSRGTQELSWGSRASDMHPLHCWSGTSSTSPDPTEARSQSAAPPHEPPQARVGLPRRRRGAGQGPRRAAPHSPAPPRPPAGLRPPPAAPRAGPAAPALPAPPCQALAQGSWAGSWAVRLQQGPLEGRCPEPCPAEISGHVPGLGFPWGRQRQ